MHEHSAHRHNQLRTQDNIKIASAGLFCILQCYFHIYWVFFLLVVLNRHWPGNNYCDMNAQFAFFSNVKCSAANSPKKKRIAAYDYNSHCYDMNPYLAPFLFILLFLVFSWLSCWLCRFPCFLIPPSFKCHHVWEFKFNAFCKLVVFTF